MDDRALVQRCLAGDRGAWDEFVSRYSPLLRAAVAKTLLRLRRTTPADEIDDLVQSIIVHLLDEKSRRLETYRGQARLSGWLYSVAVRFTLNHLRRTRRLLVGPLDESQLAVDPEEPEDPLPWREALLKEALESLSARDRLILRMRFFDGLSYRSMSKVLKVPVNTLSPALARARNRLRDAVQKIRTKQGFDVSSDMEV